MLKCWNVGLPTNYSIIFFFYFKRNHFIFPLQDFVGTLTFQHSNIFRLKSIYPFVIKMNYIINQININVGMLECWISDKVL